MDKQSTYAVIRQYVAFLKTKEYKINEVFLFGSYARGHENNDSDIDLAIILDSIDVGYKDMINLMKYRRNFDLRIEPHLFSVNEFTPSNPFVNEIIQTGVKII